MPSVWSCSKSYFSDDNYKCENEFNNGWQKSRYTHKFTLACNSVFDHKADSANLTSVFKSFAKSNVLKSAVTDIMAALSRRFFAEVEIARPWYPCTSTVVVAL